MLAVVNVNGILSNSNSAMISVLDNGFLFGEGVYETLRTYNRRPFLLDRHLQRLRTSAGLISLPVPLDDTGFASRINETTSALNAPGERYIRVLLTRGTGDLTYDPAACSDPSIVIIVKPHVESLSAGKVPDIKIVLSSVMRNHPDAINPRIKSNNLLNNALAMQEAIRQGAGEALMRNYRGEIAECAQSNFFVVRRGEVLTPPLDSGLLEGVTRNFIFEVAAEVGIPIRECVLRPDDLEHADEMFLTGTTREVQAVTWVDTRQVGDGCPGPITCELGEAFRHKAHALTTE